MAAQGDAAAAQMRAALRAPGDGAGGGHATLLRAPAELRAGLEVFQPMDAAKQALVARLKDGFDPRRVLNPGRMYAGV